MVSRRSRFDPLATADRLRWLVVKDMHGAVLGCTVIPAGKDLHDLMEATIRARQADGWTVENCGRYGFLSCHKAGVRRMVVTIAQMDPAQPLASAHATQPTAS